MANVTAPVPKAKAASKKKKGPGLGEIVFSQTNKPPIDKNVMALAKAGLETAIALLEGRVQADDTDDTYLTLNRKPPLVSKEFLDFKKGTDVIPLPPKGTRLRDDLEHEMRRKIDAAPEDQSFIDIQILESKGIAIITNTYYLPPEMGKVRSKLATQLKKIISSGNEEHILIASGCWEGLKYSLEQQSGQLELAVRANFKGKGEFAQLTRQISNTYGEIATEMGSRIQILAKGENISQADITDTTPMQKKLAKLQIAAANLQREAVLDAFTGIRAIDSIEEGISLGIYSNIEIVIYKQIAGELKATLGRVKGFSRKGLKRIKEEGYSGLAGWQKNDVEHALSLVAQLECIAWKADMKTRINLMKAAARGYSSPTSIMRPLTKLYIPTSQLTRKSRAEIKNLAKRAEEHIIYVKSFLNAIDELTPSEKEAYEAKLNALSSKLSKARLPAELKSISNGLTKVLLDAEMILSERYLEKKASDKDNPWNVRTSAYIKLYALNHSLEIIGAGLAVGGIAGGAATRSPAGAWAGAKAGALVGSRIVALAGTFVTAEAMHRYCAGVGDLNQALEDMRLGVTYMAFGLIGGAPVAALSTPVKVIAGGGVAATSGVLLYNDLKRGNYWEIPADVAYLAIGTVAFVRVAGGLFRAVRLSTPLKSSMVIANSSGVAKVALKGLRKVEGITTRALKVGYTPTWIGMNAAFGGFGNWNNISTAIDGGHYGVAFRYLNRGFADMTRGMVGFDFALFGVGGSLAKAGAKPALRLAKAGAQPALRFFRVSVPAAQAKTVNFLASTGLYERVSRLAQKAGANTFKAQTNSRILELAFASKGKATAGYVQATLNLESRAAARGISTEINSSWRSAKSFLAKGKSAGKAAWRRVGKNMKRAAGSRAARLAARGAQGGVLVGIVGYHEFHNAKNEKRAAELDYLINKQESQFINYLLAAARPDFGTPQLEMLKLVEAMGIINEISNAVDEGTHPLAIQLEMGGDLEQRKKILLSGALALMMNGKKVTDINLTNLLSKMDVLSARTGIKLELDTPIGTMALLGSIALKEGADSFAEAYNSMALGIAPNERFAFLDYAAASYYCASSLGRSIDWANDVSFAVFDAFKKNDMEGKVLMWGLVLTFQSLEENSPPLKQIIATAKRADWAARRGGFAVSESE